MPTTTSTGSKSIRAHLFKPVQLPSLPAQMELSINPASREVLREEMEFQRRQALTSGALDSPYTHLSKAAIGRLLQLDSGELKKHLLEMRDVFKAFRGGFSFRPFEGHEHILVQGSSSLKKLTSLQPDYRSQIFQEVLPVCLKEGIITDTSGLADLANSSDPKDETEAQRSLAFADKLRATRDYDIGVAGIIIASRAACRLTDKVRAADIVSDFSRYIGDINQSRRKAACNGIIDIIQTVGLDGGSIEGRQVRARFVDLIEKTGYAPLEGKALLGASMLKMRDEGELNKTLHKLSRQVIVQSEMQPTATYALSHILQAIDLDPNSPKATELRTGLEEFVWYAREHPIRVLKAWADGTNYIPATVKCAASLDLDFPVNRGLLSVATKRQVVDQTSRNWFRIPLWDPRRIDDFLGTASRGEAHFRSVHEYTSSAFVFKNVGTLRSHDSIGFRLPDKMVAFSFNSKAESDVHKFLGGGIDDLVRGEVQTARKLRRLFREGVKKNPLLQLAAEYGVTEDLFVEPVAVFKPHWIPVRQQIGAAVPTVKLMRHGKGMSLAGIPEEFAQKHRVYCYRTLVPERNAELPEFREGGAAWDRITGIIENLPGEKLNGLPIQLKTAVRAAGGYAVVNRIVHKELEGACTTDHGSVFQTNEHNLNPLTIFDYDTIWEGKEEHELGLKHSKETYQRLDNEGAIHRIEDLCKKLGLGETETKKALKVYDVIYNTGEKTK
ncbi:MAG: hypothetical protein ABH950_04830 [Candidatus Altiarchaeota archaeon]